MAAGGAARLRRELQLAALALQFLTRLPLNVGGFEPDQLRASVRHFPLVGALVGGAGAVVLWLGLLLWPAPVAVLLSMGATAWLTGGLHEDGLADSCDALLGNAPKEQALAIMKDPRIGSYGVLGLVFVLALKAAALYGLALASLSMAAAALVVAHAVSRAMAVLLLARLPYAGDAQNAKARPMALPAAPGDAMVAIAWAVLALLGGLAWLSPMQIAGAGAAAALVALLIALRLQQRLGGITGDTLGATQQCSELAVLLAVLAAA